MPFKLILFTLCFFEVIFAQNIEQHFNVTTVKALTVQSAKEQINYGYVVADESRVVKVNAWFSGYVTHLFANKIYTKVEKGDPLVTLYSPEVYKAKQDYLHALGFNDKQKSSQMVKSAKSKLRLLGISPQEIKAIASKRKVSESTTIYAPQSGWITQKYIHQGSTFGKQSKLFEIINLKRVWIEAKLFQEEIKNLSHLENFKLEIKGITENFEANKSLLYPLINPKEATLTLRLEANNPKELLKIGMFVKIHATAKNQKRLVIPRTAVVRKNGLWYLFLATEFKGEYEPLQVEIEPLDAQRYEVISGIKEGDSIVNNALFMMDADAQINGTY